MFRQVVIKSVLSLDKELFYFPCEMFLVLGPAIKADQSAPGFETPCLMT